MARGGTDRPTDIQDDAMEVPPADGRSTGAPNYSNQREKTRKQAGVVGVHTYNSR